MNHQYDAFDLDRNEYTFNQYIQNVFGYMSLGLLVTSAVSYLCFRSFVDRGLMYHILFSIPYAFIPVLFAELAISFLMGRYIYKLNKKQLTAMFFLYAILNGLSVSTIFIVYRLSDIFMAFVFATGFFISMAIIGKTTKLDLTKYRTIFIAGLISLSVLSVITLFTQYNRLDLVLCWAGLLLFMGLTAYDIQKVRNIYYNYAGEMETGNKLGILGAFELYLDFINMFMYILRILSSRRHRD
ncbi:MAG: Bax inhibitor-1/YccA family protein [Erysipelotrichaceae bacterium]|nr:Bax inhibitor-1/YccA family protein [Erysipelotrichaceae bacterium]